MQLNQILEGLRGEGKQTNEAILRRKGSPLAPLRAQKTPHNTGGNDELE